MIVKREKSIAVAVGWRVCGLREAIKISLFWRGKVYQDIPHAARMLLFLQTWLLRESP